MDRRGVIHFLSTGWEFWTFMQRFSMVLLGDSQHCGVDPVIKDCLFLASPIGNPFHRYPLCPMIFLMGTAYFNCADTRLTAYWPGQDGWVVEDECNLMAVGMPRFFSQLCFCIAQWTYSSHLRPSPTKCWMFSPWSWKILKPDLYFKHVSSHIDFSELLLIYTGVREESSRIYPSKKDVITHMQECGDIKLINFWNVL